ncbi:MAG TPA: 1-deoxy-D-xylulose-5-phosphate reductoisomerase [Bacteroidetes bacterium]|nr:1-deoxy-D-xylulose-5-phosphate reductoisomerase [Bacteroidota bacterium]
MENKQRNIAILGSTGSIGTQALEVMALFPERLGVSVLTANNNAELLIAQARQFEPNAVVIGNEALLGQVRDALSDTFIKVYAGAEALEQIVEMDEIDMVLTALVGFAGLRPTIRAIKAGKHIALANKETMVVAGQMINALARAHRVSILPVDSEHSALFQCLVGEHMNPIEKIYLTASGGPFRGFNTAQLAEVSLAQALKHPNWDMGAKITIDSASMMNKGLEVIEAKWLFDLKDEQIDIIVHPQSIVHSLVQFEDGSMKAQMGLPDMRLPIQYALCFPERWRNPFPRFQFMDYPSLTFEQVDRKVFLNLEHAFSAMRKGGNAPCILNAANEIAVQLFLESKIRFKDIAELNGNATENVNFVEKPDLETLLETDRAAREWVLEHVKTYSFKI